MLEGKNKNLEVQIEVLEKILKQNKTVWKVLEILEEYAKENKNFKDYYLSAGCINQTVFNYYHNYPLEQNIKDYDIVYYEEDTSYEAEDIIIKEIQNRVKELNIECDIKNEKRVPIWYNEKYHTNRGDYTSTEDAIRRWTTTITSIGVRLENKKLIVCAPYGLNDLFTMTIRPIKLEITKEIYEGKCEKWKKYWPKLNIIEWDSCN